MKKILTLLSLLFVTLAIAACGFGKPPPSKSLPSGFSPVPADKILITVFSATGNTMKEARTLQKITGADLFVITPEEPYTKEDLEHKDKTKIHRATREQKDRTARPKIAGTIPNLDKYEVILVGFPIWWEQEPRIIDTFLESYDWKGKILIPFYTSGGSTLGDAESELHKLAPSAHFLKSMNLTGLTISQVQERLEEYKVWNGK